MDPESSSSKRINSQATDMPVGAPRLSFIKVLDSYITELNETLWLKELMQLPKVPTFISTCFSENESKDNFLVSLSKLEKLIEAIEARKDVAPLKEEQLAIAVRDFAELNQSEKKNGRKKN